MPKRNGSDESVPQLALEPVYGWQVQKLALNREKFNASYAALSATAIIQHWTLKPYSGVAGAGAAHASTTANNSMTDK